MTLFNRNSDAFVAPEPSSTPPSITDTFNAASGSSAAAVTEVGQIIDRLVDANLGLDDAVMRAQSEIDRLTEVMEAAEAQRERNLQVIACLESAEKKVKGQDS